MAAEGLNKWIGIGNLGADPELRFTQGGDAVLNFRIATTEKYVDRHGDKQEKTNWHSCVLWGKRGEALSKILEKGMTVFVEGSIENSSYDDKDGNKRYKSEIKVLDLKLLGGGAKRDDEDRDRGRGRGRDDRDRDRGRGRDDDRDRDRGRRDDRDRDRGRNDRDRDRDRDRGSRDGFA